MATQYYRKTINNFNGKKGVKRTLVIKLRDPTDIPTPPPEPKTKRVTRFFFKLKRNPEKKNGWELKGAYPKEVDVRDV